MSDPGSPADKGRPPSDGAEDLAAVIVPVISPQDFKENPEWAILARLGQINPKTIDVFRESLSDARRERQIREERNHKLEEQRRHREFWVTLTGRIFFGIFLLVVVGVCVFITTRNVNVGAAVFVTFLTLAAYAVFGRSMPKTFSLSLLGLKVNMGYDSTPEDEKPPKTD